MNLFHNKYNDHKKTGLIWYWVNLNSQKILVKIWDEYFSETAGIFGVCLNKSSKHYILNTKKETKKDLSKVVHHSFPKHYSIDLTISCYIQQVPQILSFHVLTKTIRVYKRCFY